MRFRGGAHNGAGNRGEDELEQAYTIHVSGFPDIWKQINKSVWNGDDNLEIEHILKKSWIDDIRMNEWIIIYQYINNSNIQIFQKNVGVCVSSVNNVSTDLKEICQKKRVDKGWENTQSPCCDLPLTTYAFWA